MENIETQTLTRAQLIQFFEERPSISKRNFAKECEISLSSLKYFLTGERSITPTMEEKLLPKMKIYGFNYG